jgi:hypothetical protein
MHKKLAHKNNTEEIAFSISSFLNVVELPAFFSISSSLKKAFTKSPKVDLLFSWTADGAISSKTPLSYKTRLCRSSPVSAKNFSKVCQSMPCSRKYCPGGISIWLRFICIFFTHVVHIDWELGIGIA